MLPEDYDSAEQNKYPVVYLTHGIGCTPDDWNDKYIQFENTLTQLESEGLGDMIYIFPTKSWHTYLKTEMNVKGLGQLGFYISQLQQIQYQVKQVASNVYLLAKKTLSNT